VPYTASSALLQPAKKILLVCLLIAGIAGCSPNNVSVDDSLGKYFEQRHVRGTFALFDNGQGHFTVYNLLRYRDSAYLPASTFKIVNSLIGLQTGRVSNEKMVIPWDGVVRIFPNGDTAKAWNQDLTMEKAFEVSAVPYYQEVARRIGKDTMQFWLDSLHYGNHTIGGRVDSFWLDNSLTITPDEQLGLVKRLYFGQLPFQKRVQDIVKKMMVRENTSKYILAYKGGLGTSGNGNEIGLMVGWVEENRHPYFFVLNTEGGRDLPMANMRLDLLKDILKQLGFLEGKR